VLEIVHNATDMQTVNVVVTEIIVSALGGTIATEDSDVMASTQAMAELMRVLLNASGGRGRKAISDLKNSHLIRKNRLSRDWPMIGTFARKHPG
jgi:hypothetical protein